ncbi:hypothetical protein JHK82_033550 [Glycine max]|nr:hypothetical protein JHK82_033550 [Glycine max]
MRCNKLHRDIKFRYSVLHNVILCIYFQLIINFPLEDHQHDGKLQIQEQQAAVKQK